MGDDVLAGPCTRIVGVANSVGALWSVGGGAWVVCVVVCCGCFVRRKCEGKDVLYNIYIVMNCVPQYSNDQ